MDISYDYRDLLNILNKYKVQYLVVGAHAVTYYTEPRFSKDLDIWVNPTKGNAQKVYDALKEFGAPLKSVRAEDFTNPKTFYQIGVSPIRIDIITKIGPIKFSNAWQHKKRTKYADVPINILGLQELIKSKSIYKRKQDLLDLERLKHLCKNKKGT